MQIGRIRPEKGENHTMTNSTKYITRMEYEKIHGWNVRWSPSGEWEVDTRSKLFSDGVYGSKAKALEAAKAFRDKVVSKKMLGKRRVAVRRHALNTSGVIGVYYDYRWRDGCESFAWVGNGYKDGKFWRKSFSIKKYTEKGAFLWACRERYKRHGDLHIHCRIKDLPCSPGVPYVLHRK